MLGIISEAVNIFPLYLDTISVITIVFLVNEDILTTHRWFGSYTQSKKKYNELLI